MEQSGFETHHEAMQAKHELELEDAWKAAMQTEGGRLLLHSILAKCELWRAEHHGNGIDQVNLGRRQIGLEILSDHVFPIGMDVYTQMLMEGEKRENELMMAIEKDERRQDGNDGQ